MSGWPRLDYAVDRPTIETIHALLQLLGKLPVRLHPWLNHGWHVALRMTPCGAITRSLPAGGRHFTAEFDFLRGRIRLACDNGDSAELPVVGKSVAEVHGELTALLGSLGLPAPLWGGPNETPDPVPFAQDHAPRPWNGEAARRLHGALLQADRCFTAFRSLYRGKSSPSHLFWGSFDLAITRFSGRAAPEHPGGIPALPDAVTREAYSQEVISAGFWPGGGGYDEAAFYAYAYPVPAGLGEQPLRPPQAFWHAPLGEFLLPYRAVSEAAEPETVLQEFLQSTYAAAAKLLDWPEGLVTAEQPCIGHPPHAD
ncbi:conserved hypothetical protein [Altererythrobacter sp. B11]|uniref:DUF5996 family protein n=1 Tax=Altererythrobacter sp. B11 TaxID=2060312 RepID=UPI000DC72E04|nr:DUF5996 family protein [Altererythrobacter sp. B11]BBC72344.1 conserved hypothetical protein [Altererythrobacter sp. B11]